MLKFVLYCCWAQDAAATALVRTSPTRSNNTFPISFDDTDSFVTRRFGTIVVLKALSAALPSWLAPTGSFMSSHAPEHCRCTLVAGQMCLSGPGTCLCDDGLKRDLFYYTAQFTRLFARYRQRSSVVRYSLPPRQHSKHFKHTVGRCLSVARRRCHTARPSLQ